MEEAAQFLTSCCPFEKQALEGFRLLIKLTSHLRTHKHGPAGTAAVAAGLRKGSLSAAPGCSAGLGGGGGHCTGTASYIQPGV